MKKIKKALIGITSLVMAFTMTAFCACSKGNTGDNNGDNTGNNTEQGGNNNGQGGNEQTESEAKKIIGALQGQSFKGFSAVCSEDMKIKRTSYASDKDGVKAEGAQEQVSWIHEVTTSVFNNNPIDMEYDATEKTVTEFLKADGSAVDPETEAEVEFNASFVRGSKYFYINSDEEITDYSKAELEYAGYTDVSGYEYLNSYTDGVSGSSLSPVAGILNLADIYGEATFADKKLAVNLNKVAYKLYSDVKAEVDKINENTTVKDVITAEPVKNLIESATYGQSANYLVRKLKSQFGGSNASADDGMMAMVGGIVKALPDAAEGESVYDYLVKVLNSKEFGAALIGGLTGSPLDVPVALGDFKVAQIVNLVVGLLPPSDDNEMSGGESGGVSTQAEEGQEQGEGQEEGQPEMTIADVKDMIKGYLDKVTVTEDKFTLKMDSTVDITNAQLVVSVNDDYEVSSVSVTADVASVLVCVDGSDDEYMAEETVSTGKIDAKIELSKEKLTLTDIDNVKVNVSKYEYADETRYEQIGAIVYNNQEEDDYHSYGVYVGVTVQSGSYDIAAYIKNEEDEYESLGSAYYSGTGLKVFGAEGVDIEGDGILFNVKLNDKQAHFDEILQYGYFGIEISYNSEASENSYADNYSGYFIHMPYYSFSKTEKVETYTVAQLLAGVQGIS